MRATMLHKRKQSDILVDTQLPSTDYETDKKKPTELHKHESVAALRNQRSEMLVLFVTADLAHVACTMG